MLYVTIPCGIVLIIANIVGIIDSHIAIMKIPKKVQKIKIDNDNLTEFEKTLKKIKHI